MKLFDGINDLSNNDISFWFLHKKSKATQKGGGKHALASYHFLVYLLSDIKMLEYK